jgi:hypothetical protein
VSALKVLKRSLTLVAGPVVVGYLVWFLWERRGQLVEVLHVGQLPFAVVAVLTLFAMLARAAQFQVLLGALDTRISFGRAACLIMSGQLMNYLLFSPGTIMQAVILKREEALRYARFVSLWAAQAVLLLFCASVFAIAGMVLSRAPWRGGSGVMLFVLVATALGPVIVLCVPKRWVASDGTLLRKWLGDVLAGWERLGAQHGRLDHGLREKGVYAAESWHALCRFFVFPGGARVCACVMKRPGWIKRADPMGRLRLDALARAGLGRGAPQGGSAYRQDRRG